MSRGNNDGGIRKLALHAMFVALVAVGTMVIRIPLPATRGFVNVGDTLIFVAALLLGPQAGLVAGGLGSALADVLSGYAHWAPWTLIIKGLEGFIVGYLGSRALQEEGNLKVRSILAMVVGAAWMVAGYFGAGTIMEGMAAALGSLPGNVAQGVASIVLASPLVLALNRLEWK